MSTAEDIQITCTSHRVRFRTLSQNPKKSHNQLFRQISKSTQFPRIPTKCFRVSLGLKSSLERSLNYNKVKLSLRIRQSLTKYQTQLSSLKKEVRGT